MGFLDNTTITVDAILTKKGREKLARNGDLNITHYAFADDEIDYGLYDVSHPNGSSYYGAVLENMPLLEAFVDETQVMRYKLFTADKDLPKLATIKGLRASEKLELGTDGKNLIPTTDGFTDDVYDFTIQNVDVASMTSEGTTPSFARDGRSAVIRNVKRVNLKATDRTGLTNPIVQTVVFVTSRNTGATTSVIIKNDSTGQFPND
jgi:hypothetical protein|tara:strand:- start:25 stop:642 length:618 start_codon:yes stop_codon:yes gene_type:complete